MRYSPCSRLRGRKRIGMAELEYQSGFGNEFATEAMPGALPVGRNAPQKNALGLYTEQVSGSAFTAPRGQNRRTWMYRIRPSVVHEPYQAFAMETLLRSGPFDEVPTPPNQMRWNPPGFPEAGADFVEGLLTLGAMGIRRCRMAWACISTRRRGRWSGRFFYNADGEMLILPQEGGLRLRTECGVIEVRAGRARVVPRGIKFRSSCWTARLAGISARTMASRFACRTWGRSGRTGWQIPGTSSRRWRRLRIADGEFEVVSKFLGQLVDGEVRSLAARRRGLAWQLCARTSTTWRASTASTR